MLYDREERQILNQYPNTLAHDLLRIDIAFKKLRREYSKAKAIRLIEKILHKTVIQLDKLIRYVQTKQKQFK